MSYLFLIMVLSCHSIDNENPQVNQNIYSSSDTNFICKTKYDTIDFTKTKNWKYYSTVISEYIVDTNTINSFCTEHFLLENLVTSEKFSFIKPFIDSVSLIKDSYFNLKLLKVLLLVPSFDQGYFNKYSKQRSELMMVILEDSSSNDYLEKGLLNKLVSSNDTAFIYKILSDEINSISSMKMTMIQKKNYYAFVYLLRLHYKRNYSMLDIDNLKNFLQTQ